MTASHPLLRLTRHERLAPLAFAAAPAWLWALDGTRVLWANAAGAVLLDGSTPARLSERTFGSGHPAAREVARLVGGMPGAHPPVRTARPNTSADRPS